VLRNELAFALRDTTPVSDLHTLVLPFRHAPTYFDLTPEELAAANDLLRRLGAQISQADPSVEGFNIGANVGLVSGQTIFHCHIHLIPRRRGDVENPLGGVRGVIPDKMRY
jgi:ATP adenylyltransferase